MTNMTHLWMLPQEGKGVPNASPKAVRSKSRALLLGREPSGKGAFWEKEHSGQGALWACRKCSCLSGVFSLPAVWLLWRVNEHVGGSSFLAPAMPTLELIIPQMRDNMRPEVPDAHRL